MTGTAPDGFHATWTGVRPDRSSRPTAAAAEDRLPTAVAASVGRGCRIGVGGVCRAPDAWTGTRGLVTDALTAVLPQLSDGEAYLAGPPPMVAAVRALLDGHGVSVDRVHVDSFG